jgi:hypothetical protein
MKVGLWQFNFGERLMRRPKDGCQVLDPWAAFSYAGWNTRLQSQSQLGSGPWRLPIKYFLPAFMQEAKPGLQTVAPMRVGWAFA